MHCMLIQVLSLEQHYCDLLARFKFSKELENDVYVVNDFDVEHRKLKVKPVICQILLRKFWVLLSPSMIHLLYVFH